MPPSALEVGEVAPGVFRMALPLGMQGITSVNSYLLDDPSGATLVDCGIAVPGPPEDGTAALRAALRGCGAELSDVRRVVITHAHVDHYGLAGEVVRATGADLWMHVRSDAELAKYRDPDAAVGVRQQMLAEHGVTGQPLDEAGDALREWLGVMPSMGQASTRLRGGEHVQAAGLDWEVVHTPGHSPGHVCLWAPGAGLLLSGDHLLPGVVPPVTYERGLALDPLGSYLTSLAEVERLAPALVLPGHNRPFPDGAARARTLARSKTRRLDQVLRVLEAEPLPVAELSERLFGGALPPWRRVAFTAEVLACLAHLDVRGTAYRVSRPDGVVEWHALRGPGGSGLGA